MGVWASRVRSSRVSWCFFLFAALLLDGCVSSEEGRERTPPSTDSLSPSHSLEESASPSPIEETPLSLRERLAQDVGIRSGEPYPRAHDWGISKRRNYRNSFDFCFDLGLRHLATQLHVDDDNPVAAAIAFIEAYPKEEWRSRYEGCIDGLLFRTEEH